MNHGVVSFKVFLREGGKSEARRFVVDDASVITNYHFMKEKIQTVFPALRGTTFKIMWKDADDDEITIVNDEDLITAFTEMSGGLKVLHVEITDDNSDSSVGGLDMPMMMRVSCDKCNNFITGYRYKCLQCPDFDLCSNCEHQGNHSHHIMLRASQQQDMPRCIPKLMGLMSRSMRKSHHYAAKEAHRASKHCKKENACPKASCPKPNTTEAPQEQVYESFDFISNIASMARPFVEEFCNTNLATAAANEATAKATPNATPNATPTASNTKAPENNEPKKAPYEDLVRNAIQAIFGQMPQQQQQQPTTSAKSSGHQSAENTPTESTPMEVEQPKQDLYPQLQKEKLPEPGWTFVPRGNGADNTGMAGTTTTTAVTSPPPFVPSAPNTAAATNSEPVNEVNQRFESDKIREGLEQLLEMGFSNEINLIALLKRFDGNVGYVVKYLFENNL